MVYKEDKYGVFVQATDGTLVRSNYWDNSKTPNGIAVVTENCSFVMALSDAYSSLCNWDNANGGLIQGITTTTEYSEAESDYDGSAQTEAIIGQSGNNAEASWYCKNFTFPNGKKGYLGAAGEWNAIIKNHDAVVNALFVSAGYNINGEYWTSTQYDNYRAWYVNTDYGFLDGQYAKNGDKKVRAFCSI